MSTTLNLMETPLFLHKMEMQGTKKNKEEILNEVSNTYNNTLEEMKSQNRELEDATLGLKRAEEDFTERIGKIKEATSAESALGLSFNEFNSRRRNSDATYAEKALERMTEEVKLLVELNKNLETYFKINFGG